MALYTNLVDGESALWDINGWTITTSVVVSDISQALPAVQKLPAAISATGAVLGEAHLTYPNSYLQRVKANALSADTVRLDFEYEPMTALPVQITLDGGVEQTETNLNAAGSVMTVSYHYPTDYEHNPAMADKWDTVVKTVQKDVPALKMTIQKREITTGLAIKNLHQTYAGKLNAANWNLLPADAAGTWKCDYIGGTYVGIIYTGALYYIFDVQYTFSYRADGWKVGLAYIDPNTGELPPQADWIADQTVKESDIYSQVSFNALTSDMV